MEMVCAHVSLNHLKVTVVHALAIVGVFYGYLLKMWKDFMA
jgi:hypothetical protein